MVDTTAPCVSVVIPARDAAATIRRALDSVLAQAYRSFEIIVVDDASRDTTADVVASRYGELVRLLRLAHNVGVSGATNAGMAAARGALIAFLDADDEWLPDKLAMQVAALENNRSAVMAACGCRFTDTLGRLSRDSGIVGPDIRPGEVWRELLARTLIAKPCVIVRATALRAVGPFDISLAVGEDQDMWIRLALVGDVVFVPAVLTIVHDSAASLTKRYASQIDHYLLPMIRRHVEQQRQRLSRREVRTILGERYATVGRNLYSSGALLRGASLLLRSALLGHRAGAGLWYLITAAPPMKAMKRFAPRRAQRCTRSTA